MSKDNLDVRYAWDNYGTLLLQGQEVKYIGNILSLFKNKLGKVHGIYPERSVVKVQFFYTDTLVEVKPTDLVIMRGEVIPEVNLFKRKHIFSINTEDRWNFRINRLSNIKWDEIQNDLSWDNPIALVTLDGPQGKLYYAVVFKPLNDKAYFLERQYYKYMKDSFEVKDDVFQLDGPESVPDIKGWANEIKKATWPDAFKADVTVNLLKV